MISQYFLSLWQINVQLLETPIREEIYYQLRAVLDGNILFTSFEDAVVYHCDQELVRIDFVFASHIYIVEVDKDLDR